MDDISETTKHLLTIAGELRNMRELIAAMREEVKYLVTLTDSRPAPMAGNATPNDSRPIAAFRDFTAEAIIMTYSDKGEPAYKIIGYPYLKYGVRVWPEILPALHIDPAGLKPGPNPYTATVRALLVNSVDKETGEVKTRPQKIIGLGACLPAEMTARSDDFSRSPAAPEDPLPF
jgi:hypothetical protein